MGVDSSIKMSTRKQDINMNAIIKNKHVWNLVVNKTNEQRPHITLVDQAIILRPSVRTRETHTLAASRLKIIVK